MPFAIMYLFLYTIGYPIVVCYIVVHYKLMIMEDQVLVAKETGDTRLTNPHCYDFRKMYQKLYYQVGRGGAETCSFFPPPCADISLWQPTHTHSLSLAHSTQLHTLAFAHARLCPCANSLTLSHARFPSIFHARRRRGLCVSNSVFFSLHLSCPVQT